MVAGIPHDLGRLVYYYGGKPVASFFPPPSGSMLKPSVTHAMFMDATHDNEPGNIQVSHASCHAPVLTPPPLHSPTVFMTPFHALLSYPLPAVGSGVAVVTTSWFPTQ